MTAAPAEPVGEVDKATVVSALAHLIDLVEGWAYGPLFEKAGVQWPDGKCQAPALVKAKEIIAILTRPSGGGR